MMRPDKVKSRDMKGQNVHFLDAIEKGMQKRGWWKRMVRSSNEIFGFGVVVVHCGLQPDTG